MAAYIGSKASSNASSMGAYEGDKKDAKSSGEQVCAAAAVNAISSTATVASAAAAEPFTAQFQPNAFDPQVLAVSTAASGVLSSATESNDDNISKPLAEFDEEEQKAVSAYSKALAEDLKNERQKSTISLDKMMSEATYNRLCEMLKGIPKGTNLTIARGVKIGQEIFSSGGVFPQWLSWGFVTYRLLKKYAPNESEGWSRILSLNRYFHHLKEMQNLTLTIDGKEQKLFSEQALLSLYETFLLEFTQGVTDLYRRCAVMKNPKIQDLLDTLTLIRMGGDDRVPFPHYPPKMDTQGDYEQLLELMEFVDKLARFSSGTNSILLQMDQHSKKSLNWCTLFPKRLSNLNKKSKEVVKEMSVAFGFIKSLPATAQVMHIAKISKRSLTLMDASGKPMRSSNRIHQALADSETDYLRNTCVLEIGESAYEALINALMPTLDSMANTPSTIGHLKAKIISVSQNLFPSKGKVTIFKNVMLNKGLKCINTFAANNNWDDVLKNTMGNLLFALEAFHKNGPKLGLSSTGGNMEILTHIAFHKGCPYLILQVFRHQLKNLSYFTAQLNEVRESILKHIQKSLQSIPYGILSQNYGNILKCINELHIITSGSLLDILEVLFASARVLDEEQFILRDDSVMPPNSIERHVVDFVSLAGLKKVTTSVKKSLDPSKIQEDLKHAAAAKFDLKVEGALPFANLPVLPPSGESFDEVAATATSKPLSRKEKRAAKKHAVPSGASTGASATAASNSSRTAGTAVASSVEDTAIIEAYELTPTKMTELKDLLERYGYYLLREGHRHSIYKTAGKNSIAIPRHMGGSGTMEAVKKQVVKKA